MADLSCPITPVTEEEKRRKVVRGLQVIRDLPIARSGGLILGVRELDALVFAVRQYLASDNKATPPTKDFLRAAVLSLLQEGVSLSKRWDKTQLALIVQKWALSAIQLSPRHAQANLFVQTTLAVEKRKKVLLHKCWLKEEGSEEAIEFSIASPSPVKPRKPAKDTSTSRETTDGHETDLYEMSDLDEAFLKEIDELAQQADLAAIPVHFYTPGVDRNPHADENVQGAPRLPGTVSVTSTT